MPSTPTARPARSTSEPLGRVLEQHRIGVVDVRVHPVPRSAARRAAPGCRRVRRPAGGPSAARCARRCPARSARRRSRRCRRTAPAPRRPGGASSASSSPPQPGTKAQAPPVRSSRSRSPTVWPGRSSLANRGGPAGTGKAGHGEPARAPVAVAERRRAARSRARSTVTSANARVTGSSRESCSMTLCDRVAWRRPGGTGASRRSTIPSVWSSSASVRTTPSTGTWRIPARLRPGEPASCAWTSGEALSRNQRAPSALTAADDWLRGSRARGLAPGDPAGGAPAVPLGESAAGGGPEQR